MKTSVILFELSMTLGTVFEGADRSHSAIPWYKKCVKMCEDGDFDKEPGGDSRLPPSLNNLGLALKKACYLDEALACYSRVVDMRNKDLRDLGLGTALKQNSVDNRRTLLREMREWTGTAHEHDLNNLSAYKALEGRQVVLSGLTNESMNGVVATATRYSNKKGRYIIEFDRDGEAVRNLVKPENLSQQLE